MRVKSESRLLIEKLKLSNTYFNGIKYNKVLSY